MKLLEAIYAIRYPLLWLLFIGGGVFIVLVASGVQVPGLERQHAVSQETRNAWSTARAPTLSRAEAIERVREYLRTECSNGTAYLEGNPQFTAVFNWNPRTDDHHVRGEMEWSVTHTLTDDFWRFYEGTGEIITVKGEC